MFEEYIKYQDIVQAVVEHNFGLDPDKVTMSTGYFMAAWIKGDKSPYEAAEAYVELLKLQGIAENFKA